MSQLFNGISEAAPKTGNNKPPKRLIFQWVIKQVCRVISENSTINHTLRGFMDFNDFCNENKDFCDKRIAVDEELGIATREYYAARFQDTLDRKLTPIFAETGDEWLQKYRESAAQWKADYDDRSEEEPIVDYY
jgi:hypothetical protein